MTKQTGLGDQLFVDGYDIAGDVQSIGNLSTPIAALEMTGINKYAMERQYGIADAAGEFTSFFNDADDAAHEVLSTLPRTDGHLMYLRGEGAGRPAIGAVGKRIDYAGTRGDDGSLTFGIQFQGNGSVLDWAVQLTEGREVYAAAANGDGVDLGTGSKAFGWQAYIQVFSIGSGTADITVEHSSDDGVGDPYVELFPFSAVTGRTAARVASPQGVTVERYVRVTVTGTFTDLDFCVIFNRNNGTAYTS